MKFLHISKVNFEGGSSLPLQRTDPYSEHYHLVLLVAFQEGVLGRASGDVQLGAHSICVADVAGILSLKAGLAPEARLGLDQPLLDQTVSCFLKDVQSIHLNAAFKIASSFSAAFCK